MKLIYETCDGRNVAEEDVTTSTVIMPGIKVSIDGELYKVISVYGGS